MRTTPCEVLKSHKFQMCCADHERLAVEHGDVLAQEFRLIFLAEHLRRFGMMPGDGVGAELGQDERAGKALVHQVNLAREPLDADLDLPGLGVPAVVTVERNHVDEAATLLRSRPRG